MCVISCCDTKANTNAHLSAVHFSGLCEVTADMTKLKSSTKPQTNHRGVRYYTLRYDIVLLLGLTELKAQIAWMENVSDRFSWSIVMSLTLYYRE